MNDYPCCKHCFHDPDYEHTGLCLVCGKTEPVIMVVCGIQVELS